MRLLSWLFVAALALVPVAGRTAEPTVETASKEGVPAARPYRDLVTRDGLEWRTVRAIQVAATEAARTGVDPEVCLVKAMEDSEFVDVWFTNRAESPFVRGCPSGPCRCFEVRMARGTLQVIRSNYSR